MLTFATIAAGAPRATAAITNHYLTQTLPKEVADLARYYTHGSQAPELQAGDVAAELRPDLNPRVTIGLGLTPERPLTQQQVGALLAGRRADGQKIEGKRYAELRTVTDKRTGQTKELIPIGAYDFTLTPDKTVSLAWAFAEPAEQVAIWQAHRDAAHQAMSYLETIIGRARRGAGGQDGSEPGHVGWLMFDHHTARPTLTMAVDQNGQQITETLAVPVPGDPDLHTHVLVPNAVFTESGRIGALDAPQLHGAVKEVGALYQAHLATNLRDHLQASVSLDPETGMARLDAIPDAVRTHFSKRTLGGEEAARTYAKELGLDWDTLTPHRQAGLLKAGTQGSVPGLDRELRAKLRKDDMADFNAWHRQAEALGWRYAGVETYGPPMPPLSREDRLQKAYETALPWLEKELEHRAVIGVGDARAAALRGLIAHGIEHSRDITDLTDRFMAQGVRQHGAPTKLYWQETDEPRQAKLTTALHVAQERAFIILAHAAASDRRDALAPAQVSQVVQQAGIPFSDEQTAAIHRLGEGGRLGVLIGAAGVGKTTSLQPLVSAWHSQDRDVHGVALAWRQADDLTESGIPQNRVKALSVFQQAAAKGEIALSATSVVVVDELGLLGTRQGLALLQLQHQHGFRMIWMGDPKQLASIEAGPIIELSRRALGAEQLPEILTTQRQKNEREQRIVTLFRNGRAADALDLKRQDGTAELVPGGPREAIERVAALVSERLAANAGDPRYSLTVSAPTNGDAHRLGLAIRQARRAIGQVGPDAITLTAVGQSGNPYPMAIAAGDKVRLFASTRADGERGSIGRNGSVLTVLEADRTGMRVRNANGHQGRISWKRLADKQGRTRLAYGEVMTTHTAQGSTATEHIYALPSGSQAVTGFAAYASGTRHRQASYLVISEGAERAAVKRSRPLNDPRPIGAEDAWANVAANFARQPTKELASDLLTAGVALRLGAARALQASGRRAERQPGSSHLPDRFARRREAAELKAAQPALARAISWPVMHRIRDIGTDVAHAIRHRFGRSHGPDRDRGPRLGH